MRRVGLRPGPSYAEIEGLRFRHFWPISGRCGENPSSSPLLQEPRPPPPPGLLSFQGCASNTTRRPRTTSALRPRRLPGRWRPQHRGECGGTKVTKVTRSVTSSERAQSRFHSCVTPVGYGRSCALALRWLGRLYTACLRATTWVSASLPLWCSSSSFSSSGCQASWRCSRSSCSSGLTSAFEPDAALAGQAGSAALVRGLCGDSFGSASVQADVRNVWGVGYRID